MSLAKAIVVVEKGSKAAIVDLKDPVIRDEWLLVKTKAVALNPTDWKHLKLGLADDGSRLGVDYAGTVIEVGKKVTEFKKGDKIAGFAHGGNSLDHETGTFGEHILVKASAAFLIPGNLSMEQAATTPCSIYTCGLGLYMSLEIPLPGTPNAPSFPILIYGGSTATGSWAIQFAKASGLTVVTTASPRNFEYVKRLGADAVFDYNASDCAVKIKAFTNNQLVYAWDCSGGGEEICAAAMSDVLASKYGFISSVDAEKLKATNPLVQEPIYVLGYDILNEPYDYVFLDRKGGTAEHLKFTERFKHLAVSLLEDGTVRCIDFVVNKGGSGLEGVMKGMEELEHGKVSGHKLVYTL